MFYCSRSRYWEGMQNVSLHLHGVTAFPRLVYFLVNCSPKFPWVSAASFIHLVAQEKDWGLFKYYKKYSSMKIHTLHLTP